MPKLTVKAFAELIHTPLYGQVRILNEQKYPSKAPGLFKIQYYLPTINAIRRYYRQGNNLAQLPTEASQLLGAGTKPDRIENNLRAISAFRRSTLRSRTLSIKESKTWNVSLANVTLKATPELEFIEGGKSGYAILDCRLTAPEEEIIRTTVELFHLTLSENGIECPLQRVEYVHLESDTVHSWKSPRKLTITRANKTATAIEALWESL